MEHHCEYTVPMEDTVALESPIEELQLLNLEMDTEVVDLCDTVQDSEDEVEHDNTDKFVMDSDDETDQNEAENMVNKCCVIRRFTGRDAVWLAKAPAGYLHSLGNTVSANVPLASTKVRNDRSKIGSLLSDSDSRHEDGLVRMNCFDSRALDQKGIFRNSQKLHLHEDKSNMVISTSYRSRNPLNEKRSSFNKLNMGNTGRVVNYGCDVENPNLSYIESPEPADFQGKAMNFVDHYLEMSDFGFSTHIESRTSKRIKSPPSLWSKGLRSLAERVSLSCSSGKSNTFDWTEKQNAKGDYSSLRNTKDLVCAPTCDNSRNSIILQASVGNLQLENVLNFRSNEKSKGNVTVSSTLDSNLVGSNRIDEVESKKISGSTYNFIKELDEQFDAEMLQNEQVAPDSFDTDLDVQMAAQAMKTPCDVTPTPSVCSVHRDSENRFMNFSNFVYKFVYKRRERHHFLNSEETFIGWKNKRKRSRCVKVSTALNKNISCSATGQLKSLCRRNPAAASNYKCESSSRMNALRQEEFVNGKNLTNGRSNHYLSESNGCFPRGERGTREKCLEVNLLVYEKRKRARRQLPCPSHKSTEQSTYVAIHETIAGKCSIMNEKLRNKPKGLLVYSRRHRPSLEEKHSVKCSSPISASDSPSINHNGSTDRQSTYV